MGEEPATSATAEPEPEAEPTTMMPDATGMAEPEPTTPGGAAIANLSVVLLLVNAAMALLAWRGGHHKSDRERRRYCTVVEKRTSADEFFWLNILYKCTSILGPTLVFGHKIPEFDQYFISIELGWTYM